MMKNRIKDLRRAKGWTVAQLAEKINMSPSHLSNIENHNRGLEINWIEPIAKALNVRSIDILEGEWNKQEDPAGVPAIPTQYTSVPLYDMTAAAGYGAAINKEIAEVIKPLIFEQSYLRQLGNPKEIFGMFVFGDSMMPVLPDHSLVLVAPDKKDLWQGKMYLVRISDMLYVKYVEKMPGCYILKSANKTYDPITLNTEEMQPVDFEILGQVVWYSCEG